MREYADAAGPGTTYTYDMTTVSSAIPTHGNYHNYHGYVS